MRIEVIHDKDDFFSFRIHDIHKIFYLLCPVCRCSMPPDTDMVFFHQGVLQTQRYCMCHYGYIQNPLFGHCLDALATVPLLPQAAGMVFIHAYNRTFRVIRHFIDVQDIFHAGYKFCIFFWWDTPVIVVVRSKFVFKTLRMVSLLTGVSISTRHLSSKSRRCPSGMPLRHRGCRQSESDALQPVRQPYAMRHWNSG